MSAEARRRRLLNDMGIDVWYARVSPRAAKADRAAKFDRKALGPSPVAKLGAEPLAPAEPSNAAAQPVAPFAVVALGVPGALLIAGAASRRAESALAKDLVRAAGRDWSVAVRQARFDWPQPGVSGAPAPALAAFVEKQAETFAAKRLLVTETVAMRIEGGAFEFVRVPEMASLADPQNKKKLWRQLQELRG